jgi:transposase-like protein
VHGDKFELRNALHCHTPTVVCHNDPSGIKATQYVAIMYKNDGIVRRYSEGFKLKILDELSKGKFSKKKLGEIYGINRTTINEWIKKYNRKDLMNTRILVENLDETTRLKALQEEVKQLKELLIKKDLDKLVMDSYLEVAAEKLGYKSVEELKKNLNL